MLCARKCALLLQTKCLWFSHNETIIMALCLWWAKEVAIPEGRTEKCVSVICVQWHCHQELLYKWAASEM